MEDPLLGEEAGDRNVPHSPFVSEFVGTFLLCLTIGLSSVASGSDMTGLAIGSSLMVSIFMGGHISGAHHNPAVTLAVLVAGKMKCGMFGMGQVLCALGYMLAQVAAGFVAGAFAYYVCEDLGVPMGKPAVSDMATVVSAFLIEMVYTFFLCAVVLNVTAKAHEGNSFYGLAIGFLVFVGATVAGPISGGCFNPAVGIGLPIMSRDMEAMGNIWLYIVAPLLGGGIAGVYFRGTVKED